MEKDFLKLMNGLNENIKTFNYFTDWEKNLNNVKKIEKHLNILNYLLGKKDNFKQEFIDLIGEYNEIISVLPILLAVRDKNLTILNNKGVNIDFSFSPFILTDELKEKYYYFVHESGIESIFTDEKIKNLVDYVFGVEVGLDSNARKNRTGKLMEDLVEGFIEELCNKNTYLEYKEQATVSYMKEVWGLDVKSDKLSRRFDFGIYNRNLNKVYLIEVNYYNGGGSKLKAVAGEFTGLYEFMNKQGVSFYWITDGLGWNTASKPLEDAYNKMDGNIYNIEMLKEGILNKLIK